MTKLLFRQFSVACYLKADVHRLNLEIPTMTPQGICLRYYTEMQLISDKVHKKGKQNVPKAQNWHGVENGTNM